MSSQAQPNSPSTGLSTGGIVGISIVLAVSVALVLTGLVWMRRRKRRAQAAAAGGLEAAKDQQEQQQQRQLPPVNSPSNPSELAGEGGGDRGFRELEAPLALPSRDPHPPLPHRGSPRAPLSRGSHAPDERQDAGGSVDQQHRRQQAARTRPDAEASPPPRPPKEPIPPRDGGNEAAEPAVLVSGPIEMQAEDWPRPAGVVLPPEPKSAPAPEPKSMPRELSAARPQRSGPLA